MSISELPEGFNPHKGIKRVFDGRRKAVETGEGVDWGFAEALAFGTLVSEGRSGKVLSRLWHMLAGFGTFVNENFVKTSLPFRVLHSAGQESSNCFRYNETGFGKLPIDEIYHVLA